MPAAFPGNYGSAEPSSSGKERCDVDVTVKAPQGLGVHSRDARYPPCPPDPPHKNVMPVEFLHAEAALRLEEVPSRHHSRTEIASRIAIGAFLGPQTEGRDEQGRASLGDPSTRSIASR